MFASSVEMAVPLRAITTKFVKSGPNSRSTTAVRIGPISAVCPSRVSQYCACTTTSTPTITAISETNPVASSPVNKICRARTLRIGAVHVFGRMDLASTAHTTAVTRAARPSLPRTLAPICPSRLIALQYRTPPALHTTVSRPPPRNESSQYSYCNIYTIHVAICIARPAADPRP